MNLQSNMIRDTFMREIVDKTINEIHDDMVTVFGPHATDAYITIENNPYFTRDGLETIRSMKFDNPLSMYVLQILYQAVHRQGKVVGDGTTTLAVLYTNIYRTLKNAEAAYHINRRDWDREIALIVEEIKKQADTMTEEDLKSLLLTCTQDVDFAAKIYSNLHEEIMNNAYIVLNKSNLDTDFEMTTHQSPIIKAAKVFSMRPIPDKVDNAVIFHCNGILDISHMSTITDMMGYVEMNGDVAVPKTIIILCNGISGATREMLKSSDMNKLRTMDTKILETYNNFAIFTLTDYRAYSPEQLEDISTIITDEVGIGGMVNQLTFESLLHQAFGNPSVPVPELEGYDHDIRIVEKTKELMLNHFPVEFDNELGIRLNKTLGPNAKIRYDELRKDIDHERSEVKKVGLNRRLKTSYGHFIEVEVGSKLIKDSQRKYELIIDAILSSSEAVEKGVLRANSLLVAQKVLMDICPKPTGDLETSVREEIYDVLIQAVGMTVLDMVRNGFYLGKETEAEIIDGEWLIGKDLSKFDLKRFYWKDVLPEENSDISNSTYTSNTLDFDGQIVEPVSVITTILENSSLILELFNAKTFHLNSFIGNYI